MERFEAEGGIWCSRGVARQRSTTRPEVEEVFSPGPEAWGAPGGLRWLPSAQDCTFGSRGGRCAVLSRGLSSLATLAL